MLHLLFRAVEITLLVLGLLGLSQLGTDFEDLRKIVNGWLEWSGLELTQREFGFALFALAALLFTITVLLDIRRTRSSASRPKLKVCGRVDDYQRYSISVENLGNRTHVEARGVIREDAPMHTIEEERDGYQRTSWRMSWDRASPSSWEWTEQKLVWQGNGAVPALPLNKGDKGQIKLGEQVLSTSTALHAHRFYFINQSGEIKYSESDNYLGEHDDFIIELILTASPETKNGTDRFTFRLRDDSIEDITPSGWNRLAVWRKPIRVANP